ncbi:MAG: S9 family peptidase [Saprospiraceae bacterium]|nr:S9 family peptidase [Saprospiraceae bacterium]
MKNLIFTLSILLPILGMSQTFTLEEVLSAPYHSDLVSSPSGNSIAWVSNEKGQRSLLTAALPSLNPELLFKSNGDDGQLISNISFSYDDKHIFFIVGSAPNRNGEIANPASLVPYPKRLLLRMKLSDKSIDTIGSYGNYVISPADDVLLIPMGKSLLSHDLYSGKKETLLSMRGTFSNVQFSPTDDGIVFTSNRGDHSYIGLFHRGADRIDWLAPSVDRDVNPQWSPDGKQVVWIRIPGLKKGELFNLTGSTSFEIIVYNLTTDTHEIVWSSPGDDGGFAQYYPSHPIRWANSGDIVFYSEHEGWIKLYSLDPKTKEVTRLIDGDCEVEHSSMDPSGSVIVFSHNCDEIDGRDIAAYDLNEGKTTMTLNGPFIKTDPVLLSNGHCIYRKGGHNSVTTIGQMGKSINRTIFPNVTHTFPKDELVKPEKVIFKAADGLEIHGQLFVKDRSTKKPAIIFMHGGPIRQMVLGVHYRGYYANAYLMNQFLADQGYVVLSVNFRAGIGYGKNFRLAESQGPRGASEYQDIVAGAHFLQSLSFVDPDRLGLWGGSYGGLLTAQGLARDSDLFKAGVDFHGVHDWSWRATNFSPGGAWGITKDLLDQAFNSSPVADIDGWKSPVLFIHGDDDRNVMYGQTTDLVRRLRDKGVYHEILVLPDEVHGFYRWQSWYESYKATADFFNRFLKKE